ncbi:50S ribosomal protein L21 [Candidatus Palibaumannia cicadellinicola]|uniref:Large ribosomal subunit protein bL21 n=1 Tax=Candidatus Palibaumannia cicadellinicola TaxID=186490 RepID=A0A2N4XX67_9GAMM|nr:50S ribosomal protein L21 [Candidatus Baumannia cicadellinicola]PLK58969.1 50S ribosomal protein L21 [Candidatus Baumannia cicadellinicola]
MYAIFQSGGKQYRVREGQTIRIEKLNIATGSTINFYEVMMMTIGDNIYIGNPIINNSKITARVVAHGRGDKLKIIKFHRRKHFRKHQSHRQWFTDVEVMSMSI